MSYQLSLDEMSEAALVVELHARATDRRTGVCDYCHRRPSTRDCKFPERHHHKDIRPSAACIDCGGTGVKGDTYCHTCRGKGVEPT